MNGVSSAGPLSAAAAVGVFSIDWRNWYNGVCSIEGKSAKSGNACMKRVARVRSVRAVGMCSMVFANS